jgi:uncharacterized membrane protein YvbJ
VNCSNCGAALAPGEVFCWGCGQNSSSKPAKQAAGNNKGGKIVLIAVGAIVGIAITFTGVSYLISLSQGASQSPSNPNPTPTQDTGFSKQDG